MRTQNKNKIAVVGLSALTALGLILYWKERSGPSDASLASREKSISSENIPRTKSPEWPMKDATWKQRRAMELATRLASGNGRLERLQKTLNSWFQSDPAEARRWVEETTGAMLQDAANAASDPSDDRDRDSVVLDIARAWAAQDASGAIDWLKKQPPSHHRSLVLETVFNSWIAQDASKASAIIWDLDDPELRTQTLSRVAGVWAKSDSEGAVAWTHSLPEGPAKNIVIRGLLYELCQLDPSAAISHAMSFATADSEILSFTLQHWMVFDLPGSIVWLRELPEGELRSRALEEILPAWASSEPEAAAAEALYLPPGKKRNEILETVMERWAEKEPVAAMKWAVSSSEVLAQENIVQSLITHWTAKDAESAGEWLNKLPTGPLKDNSVAAFARGLGSAFPQQAQEWAATISNPSLRQEVMKVLDSKISEPTEKP